KGLQRSVGVATGADPLEDVDRRGRSTVAEVAQDQDVPDLVKLRRCAAGEVEATTARRTTESDPVLEQPEALLGVAAVVEPVGPEVEQLAGRSQRRARGANGQGVPDGEAVLEVVLVRQAT